MTNKRPAPAGREQPCRQCGSVYAAKRATSRYCSPRCRKRAERHTPPIAERKTSGLKSWLLKRGYAGRIGAGYGLTVPVGFALGALVEATESIRARGLRSIAPTTEAELRAALREMNFHPLA